MTCTGIEGTSAVWKAAVVLPAAMGPSEPSRRHLATDADVSSAESMGGGTLSAPPPMLSAVGMRAIPT
jgi:hypothetical protein